MKGPAVMIVLGLLFGALAYVASAGVQGMSGSYDRAGEVVSELTGGSYHPWLNSQLHPNSEMERLLFSLQAGVGGLLLGIFLWLSQREEG